MKTNTVSIFVAAVMLLGAGIVRSQAPGQPASAAQLLAQIRQDNAALLDRQAKTMQALDALQKEAEQLKVLGKRG
jgi:hypothetical protein